VSFEAAGSIEDYAQGSVAYDNLRAKLAQLALVELDMVNVLVESASVIITATITTANAAANEAAVTTLGQALATPSAASLILGITVLDTPSVLASPLVQVANAPSLPPNLPLEFGQATGGGGGAGAGIAVGIAAGVTALALCGCVAYRLATAQKDKDTRRVTLIKQATQRITQRDVIAANERFNSAHGRKPAWRASLGMGRASLGGKRGSLQNEARKARELHHAEDGRLVTTERYVAAHI